VMCGRFPAAGIGGKEKWLTVWDLRGRNTGKVRIADFQIANLSTSVKGVKIVVGK
jgi:hypothetical protein